MELKDYLIGLLFVLLAANLSLAKFTTYGISLFLLVLYLIKSRNKTFITILIVTALVTAGYGITKFYPKVAEPVIKFIGGGWMNEN